MTKLSLYLATILLGTNFTASTPPSTPSPPQVSQIQVSAAEQQFVDLINAERWDRGLSVLSVNPLLIQTARQHSREMYERGYFDHISSAPGHANPDGPLPARARPHAGHGPVWARTCSIVR